jgi:hypothetical protein
MSIKTYLAYTLFTLRLTGDESKPGEAVSVVNKRRTENGGLLRYAGVKCR